MTTAANIGRVLHPAPKEFRVVGQVGAVRRRCENGREARSTTRPERGGKVESSGRRWDLSVSPSNTASCSRRRRTGRCTLRSPASASHHLFCAAAMAATIRFRLRPSTAQTRPADGPKTKGQEEQANEGSAKWRIMTPIWMEGGKEFSAQRKFARRECGGGVCPGRPDCIPSKAFSSHVCRPQLLRVRRPVPSSRTGGVAMRRKASIQHQRCQRRCRTHKRRDGRCWDRGYIASRRTK